MREPKNQMLGTMEPPPLMQLSVKVETKDNMKWETFLHSWWQKRSHKDPLYL